MNMPIRNAMRVKVEISHHLNPSKTISMTMEEYRDFVNKQAELLGITEAKPRKEAVKKIDGFEGVITGVKLPKEFMIFEKIAKDIEEELKRKGK